MTTATLSRFHLKPYLLGAMGFTALWLSTIKIPLDPVPITLQTLVVLLMAFTLSRPVAMRSVLAYVAAAFFFGPPVSAGVPAVTGGFLIGFVAMAWVTGYFWHNTLLTKVWEKLLVAFMLAILGHLFVYGFGVIWLHHVLASSTGQTLEETLQKGVVPFLLWDFVKCGLAAAIALATTPPR